MYKIIYSPKAIEDLQKLKRSEIVVPVFSKDGSVRAVLDIDSKELATFDDTDRRHLENFCKMITV